MDSTTPEQIAEQAKRRVQARNGFFIHLVMYLAINGGLIVIWAFSNAAYPWFLFPLIIWGSAVAAHAITLVIGPDSRLEARQIAREADRLRRGTH